MAKPDSDHLVRIRGLHFAYGRNRILRGIDLDIPRGRVTAILGTSGSGKTTLLQLMGGSLRPARGTVEVCGRDVHALGMDELYELRRQMGMMFQKGGLFSDLSVFENVAFPIREHTRLPEDVVRDLVVMKLHAVGLRGAHHLMPAELSGGMSRRVALAITNSHGNTRPAQPSASLVKGISTVTTPAAAISLSCVSDRPKTCIVSIAERSCWPTARSSPFQRSRLRST